MDKTLAWLWLADAVGSACQYAQELLTLYPDPAELYDALRAGTETPPACLTPHALAQLRDTTPFDYEERLDHCLLSGIDVLTPDEGVYPDRLRDLPDLPLALYVTGDIACLNGRRYAGMVGTRRPSTYGRQAVYAVLKPTPQSIDALCAAASLPAGRVLAACTELELMGGAQAQPGRRYIAV